LEISDTFFNSRKQLLFYIYLAKKRNLSPVKIFQPSHNCVNFEYLPCFLIWLWHVFFTAFRVKHISNVIETKAYNSSFFRFSTNFQIHII